MGGIPYPACEAREHKNVKDAYNAIAGTSAIKRRILVAQGLYAFGALLCAVSTRWSIAFIVIVQINYALAPHLPRHGRRRSGSVQD